MPAFEDKYMGVLQNLEFALVSAYREYDDMIDFDALNSVNELIRTYNAEQKGRGLPKLKLRNECQEVAYTQLKAFSEFNMGRENLFADEDGNEIQLPDTQKYSMTEIIDCLKRVRKSIQLWQKQGGRRGYFEFVSEFVK
jgi:hypothetical protein